MKRTRVEFFYVVQFGRSYLLITSEKKSTAGRKKEKIQAFSKQSGPIKYGARRTAKTRAADARSVEKARQYGLRQLMRESGVSQHSTERFLRGERVHPATRKKLAQALETLEQRHQ